MSFSSSFFHTRQQKTDKRWDGNAYGAVPHQTKIQENCNQIFKREIKSLMEVQLKPHAGWNFLSHLKVTCSIVPILVLVRRHKTSIHAQLAEHPCGNTQGNNKLRLTIQCDWHYFKKHPSKRSIIFSLLFTILALTPYLKIIEFYMNRTRNHAKKKKNHNIIEVHIIKKPDMHW